MSLLLEFQHGGGISSPGLVYQQLQLLVSKEDITSSTSRVFRLSHVCTRSWGSVCISLQKESSTHKTYSMQHTIWKKTMERSCVQWLRQTNNHAQYILNHYIKHYPERSLSSMIDCIIVYKHSLLWHLTLVYMCITVYQIPSVNT